MVSKIKSLEKKVSGSSSKKKKSMAPHSLGVDHSSPLQGGSLPKSLTEPLLSSQGKEKTTRREGGRLPRPDAPARPPDSIESKQRKLNSIELRVELTWRSPIENPGFEYDQPVPGLLPDHWTPTSFEQAKLHQGQGSHTTLKMKKRREEPQARSSEATQLHGVLLMAVSHLQTTT
ncbi:unnamed protein product [Microthlaspi erraticum]|uniref:Uncharacterized protein n=1 Tax=Microthlaspi erraticum TaxID=1685480 RepID=A0A6D2J1S7_9BRAS|nr:unnamed protein product [Microthlaspi erraticum]